MTANYSTVTNDEFDTILQQIVSKMSVAQILAIGDVYMLLREELNNDVLEQWERENPERAQAS